MLKSLVNSVIPAFSHWSPTPKNSSNITLQVRSAPDCRNVSTRKAKQVEDGARLPCKTRKGVEDEVRMGTTRRTTKAKRTILDGEKAIILPSPLPCLGVWLCVRKMMFPGNSVR